MKKNLKELFLDAIPLFLSLSLSIIFYFIIFRFNGIGKITAKIIQILQPFIYGGVMAYLLKTPFNWVEKRLNLYFSGKRKSMAKPVALIIVMVITFVVIYTLLALIIPTLVQSVISIVNAIPDGLVSLQKFVDKYSNGNQTVEEYVGQMIKTVQDTDWTKNNLLLNVPEMMGQFASTFGAFLKIIYNIIIGVIICIYLLLFKDTLAKHGKMIIYALLPEKYADAVLEECNYIDKIFVGFFSGKILDSFIIGLICYVGCLILHFTMGLQNVVLIAVIIGVTNIIPYFGPFIGVVPTGILALMDGPAVCVVFVIFIIILQQFDGNILGPKLLSGSVGISSFWVLFSIIFFGGLFGFVGILIGVPIFAVIYDLIKRFVYYRLEKKKIQMNDILGVTVCEREKDKKSDVAMSES